MCAHDVAPGLSLLPQSDSRHGFTTPFSEWTSLWEAAGRAECPRLECPGSSGLLRSPVLRRPETAASDLSFASLWYQEGPVPAQGSRDMQTLPTPLRKAVVLRKLTHEAVSGHCLHHTYELPPETAFPGCCPLSTSYRGYKCSALLSTVT